MIFGKDLIPSRLAVGHLLDIGLLIILLAAIELLIAIRLLVILLLCSIRLLIILLFCSIRLLIILLFCSIRMLIILLFSLIVTFHVISPPHLKTFASHLTVSR